MIKLNDIKKILGKFGLMVVKDGFGLYEIIEKKNNRNIVYASKEFLSRKNVTLLTTGLYAFESKYNVIKCLTEHVNYFAICKIHINVKTGIIKKTLVKCIKNPFYQAKSIEEAKINADLMTNENIA